MRRRIVSRLLYLLDGLGRRGAAEVIEDSEADTSTDAGDGAVATRPDGLVLWMHSPNAGDAGPLPALAQELSRLRGEPVNALLTASRGRISPGMRAAVTQIAAPSEAAASVKTFFDTWSPDVCIVLGLPDRPALLGAAVTRGRPLFLAFPERGLAEKRIPMLAASLLHHFDAVLAPSGQDARLLRAGLKEKDSIVTTGPFSDTALTLPCDERELSRIAGFLASRPVWLAHHPRTEELAAIEAAHRIAARSAHRLLLILVPMPGQASSEIATDFERQGWRTARRSDALDPTADVQVFIADGESDGATDEDELWFRIAPIVFCGGTLTGGAASDPFRAAAHGTAVIHGTMTAPEDRRFRKLAEAGATKEIEGPQDLGPAVSNLLSPDVAAEMALAGWNVISESAHVIDRMARMMDAALDEVEAGMSVTAP